MHSSILYAEWIIQPSRSHLTCVMRWAISSAQHQCERMMLHGVETSDSECSRAVCRLPVRKLSLLTAYVTRNTFHCGHVGSRPIFHMWYLARRVFVKPVYFGVSYTTYLCVCWTYNFVRVMWMFQCGKKLFKSKNNLILLVFSSLYVCFLKCQALDSRGPMLVGFMGGGSSLSHWHYRVLFVCKSVNGWMRNTLWSPLYKQPKAK